MNKTLISHPTGNENVRAAVNGLYNANMLHSFHTSIACFPNNIYGKLSHIPLLQNLKRRSYSSDLFHFTHSYPARELGRLLSEKMNIASLLAHEHGYFSVDKIYRYLDRQVAGYLRNCSGVSSVYCYEDGAYDSFLAAKKKNLFCLYDLPIGYWRTMHQILEKEAEINPEWKSTLGGLNDSPEKLRRKDDEIALADIIYVASTFTKRTLSEFPGVLPPVEIIPYGFPEVCQERVFDPLKNRKMKVLYVGGLSQRKGISYMFDAIEDFKNYIELTVIGKGDISGCPRLKESLSKHRYIPSLSHSDILSLMRNYDLLLFPSLFEGFGLVVTEAMSQGMPVITTNHTCGADFIEDGENGWIVECGSSEEIRHKFDYILSNPLSITHAGKASIQTAKSRSWEVYSNELITSIKNNINLD